MRDGCGSIHPSCQRGHRGFTVAFRTADRKKPSPMQLFGPPTAPGMGQLVASVEAGLTSAIFVAPPKAASPLSARPCRSTEVSNLRVHQHADSPLATPNKSYRQLRVERIRSGRMGAASGRSGFGKHLAVSCPSGNASGMTEMGVASGRGKLCPSGDAWRLLELGSRYAWEAPHPLREPE